MTTFTAAKHLSGFDVANLTFQPPQSRDLLTVDTHLGFTTIYGHLLYALGDYRLYWVPGSVGNQFAVVRADLGVLRLLASAMTPDTAAETFNSIVAGHDVMRWG